MFLKHKKLDIAAMLQPAVVEKDVEDIWRDIFRHYFSSSKISSPLNTDGILTDTDENVIMLMEFKFDADLSKSSEISKVILQSLFYMRKFEDEGYDLPNFLFIGTKTQCAVIQTNGLIKYLSRNDIDWSLQPSQAYKSLTQIVLEIINDQEITPIVYTINKTFDFYEDVMQLIRNLNNKITTKMRLNEKNIDKIFNMFTETLKPQSIKSLSSNDLVNIFVSLMVNPDENYIHPKNPRILVTKSHGNIKINSKKMAAFLARVECEKYNAEEKEKITAMSDRLINDLDRRMKGEFFTPTQWVLDAHHEIAKVLGDDWRDKYVVWDPAWGAGNLTRDFRFAELYASTLNQSDIDVANQMGYNPEAVKFQFDFLNDAITDDDIFDENDPKVPAGLVAALKANKQIVVFMNPPYGTANDMKESSGNGTGKQRAGMANTKISALMRKNSLGNPSRQLFAQFIYRIIKIKEKYNLTNITLVWYSNPIWLTGEQYKKFLPLYLANFKFNSGYMFNAGHFSGTSAQWGILFSIWYSGKENNTSVIVDLKDLDKNGNIVSVGNKELYNIPKDKQLSKWVKDINKQSPTVQTVPLTSAITIKTTGKVWCSTKPNNSIGQFIYSSNNIYKATQDTLIVSGVYGIAGPVSATYILPSNLNKVIIAFTVRKLAADTVAWYNQKDQFIAPDQTTLHDPQFQQWYRDAVIYSLFHSGSQQSSLRNVQYNGKNYNVFNEFFWIDKDRVKDLALQYNIDEIYQDVKYYGTKNRIIYNMISQQNFKLSKKAQEVLNKANELFDKTFEIRQVAIDEHPEWYLEAWDAGWYQIKLMLKQYYPDDLKEFQKLYREFADYLRPEIYRYGFLKK